MTLEGVHGDEKLAEQIRRQDFLLMQGKLKESGVVKDETIKLLGILDGLSTNSGRFLVSSLDLSHRMMVMMNIQLLERAQDIKREYLDNPKVSDEYKIEWQKCYNEIVDIIRRSYDSTLQGTQAMARILGQGKEEKKKTQPGFKPLTRVHEVKDDAG